MAFEANEDATAHLPAWFSVNGSRARREMREILMRLPTLTDAQRYALWVLLCGHGPVGARPDATP